MREASRVIRWMFFTRPGNLVILLWMAFLSWLAWKVDPVALAQQIGRLP